MGCCGNRSNVSRRATKDSKSVVEVNSNIINIRVSICIKCIYQVSSLCNMEDNKSIYKICGDLSKHCKMKLW